MRQHKLKQRILSSLLILAMILTMIPSAFAGTPDASGHPPSGGTGDATSAGNQYNGREEFIRFSVFFAEGADWSTNGKVKQVGSSIDIYAPGCGPGYGEPQLFGDFSIDTNKNTRSSARYYQVVKPGAIRMDVRGGYYQTAIGYADGAPLDSVILGETKEAYQANKDSGNPKRMAFPIFEGDKHNTGNDHTYIQTFLKQYDAYNQILFRAQQKMYGWDQTNNKAPENVPWQTVTNIEQGIYKDADDSIVNGQYVILCESGIYGKAMGYPVAMTMREAININERMGGLYFSNYVATPIKNLCNGMYVEKDWPMLGLYGASHSETKITSLKATELIKAKFGAAVVEFPIGKSQQLPVINYFYDIKTGEIIQQALERKADNATSVPVAGNIYEAPMELNGYSLMSGFVTNKEVIKGNLDIKQNSLGFYDSTGTLKLTPEVVNMTGATDVNDIKKWDKSKELVTTVAENRKASKLVEPKHIVNTGKGLQVNYGEDTGNLQAVFLYVKNPEGTHVTKLYYDDPEATIPANKKVEPIPMPGSNRTDYDEATSGGYVIEHEDPYKVTKWSFIEDKTPGVPENITTWEDAENLANGDSGDTTGKKTAGWTDPDKELVIRYEKPKEEEPEPLATDLRLTEKRISWLKSLEDIGGIPTIQFQWNAITGHESHSCGSEHCSGHSCNERIGADSFLRFVSSNTTSVKPSIMGNSTNFMPYDINNVHEFNRSNSGGTYDMHPNYGYVIWRGQDIPTIASYKYGDTTGNGVAPNAPVIKSLLGEAQVGIAGKETRKSDKNNSFYMDDFTITEGKSNYDTGNLTAFVNTFGPQEGMAGDKKFEGVLNQFHDISTRYEIAKGDVEVAEDRMKEDKAYLDKMHRDHDDNKYGHDWRSQYRKCEPCNEAQKDYNEALADYNAKVIVRDGLLGQYNAIATMLGETKTQAGEGTKNLGDYDYSTKWSYCGKESWYTASGGSQTFTPKVQVDVGFGTAGVGDKKVTFESTNLAIGSEEWKQVQGFPINNTKTIEFWPYVEMLYDTTTGLTDQKVNVLAGHKSTIVPQDYVEIGYLPKAANGETTTGLVLQSKQWSTHQAALKLAGGAKNKVLPGGAIYRLTTPGGSGAANTRTRIAMSSWLTVLPGDTINATVSGKNEYSGTVQNNKNEALYRQVLRSLNSLDVVQVVNGTQVLQEQAGTQKVPGTSGQPTSKDAKYWLQQNIKDGVDTATNDNAIKINSVKTNEADLDITATAETRIYYRIYSDVNGNVYVSKSTTSQDDTAPGKGTILGSITKTQGLNDLLSKHNEIKALNNRTNIVENYLLAIDRNIGNDVSLTDTKWYNEAFDGICVVRINKVIEVGFKDSDTNSAARTSAIDPKLQPVRKSQSDMYKTGIKSWFETDKHTNLSNEAGYVGSFDSGSAGGGTVKINIQNMNGIYKSKEFTIPNVSVMDIY